MTEHRTTLHAVPGRYWLTKAVCSCGWTSRPTKGMFAAQAKAAHHRKVVADDDR